MQFLVNGEFTLIETKILLFLCRMTLGFKRKETNALSLKDFSKEVCSKPGDVSKALRSLINKGVIAKGYQKEKRYGYCAASASIGHGGVKSSLQF